MGALSTPDRELAALAGRQHGVVSRRQLLEIGFARAAIQRRLQSGRLHRLHRGVYAVGHPVVGAHGQWLAAVLACGPGAVLSHRSAGALWELRPSSAARIDVTVPRGSGCRSTAAIVVHRPRDAVATTVRDAITVTTPMQTLADLARILPRRAVERAAEAAEALRLFDARELPPRLLKRLDLVATTTRSPLEDAFLDLCERHGIPRPLVNTRVEGMEVDFCWPDVRLIVETDGHRHHGTRAAFERDRARDAALTAAGWRPVRVTHRQMRDEEAVAGLLLRLTARSPSPATRGSP
jgi:predicted transcriptional regulator of viral defense system